MNFYDVVGKLDWDIEMGDEKEERKRAGINVVIPIDMHTYDPVRPDSEPLPDYMYPLPEPEPEKPKPANNMLIILLGCGLLVMMTQDEKKSARKRR